MGRGGEGGERDHQLQGRGRVHRGVQVGHIESSAHQLLCVRSGLEHGRGFIRYPNGNSLDAEFVAGKIMGHGVFK